MNIKKLVAVLMTLLIFSTISTSAKEKNTNNVEETFDLTYSSKDELGKEVFQLDGMIVDLREIPQKSVTQALNPSIKKGDVVGQSATITSLPQCTSKCSFKTPLFSKPYILATSSATVVEDYIYAKARYYNSDDTLISQDEQQMNNSSYISAKAQGSAWGVYWGDYGYGNHIYRLDGYYDVICETYDEW